MTPLAFLHTPEAEALMERAADAAGVPVSLHYISRNQEGPKISGWGQCAACKHVHSLPNGGMACRLSRVAASRMALQQERTMPFVCHLGFACVVAPVLPDEGFVLTFGPYCPMEEQRSLEEDIRAGFSLLTGDETAVLPVALDDIHRTPASAVPAVASWTIEALRTAWHSVQVATEDNAQMESPESALLAPGPSRPAFDPNVGAAEDLAAALAAGSLKRARNLVIAEIEEMAAAGYRAPDARRARIVALAAAALACLVRAGIPGAAAWSGFSDFVQALSQAETNSQMADTALNAFGFLRKSEARAQVQDALPHYPELYAAVKDRLLDGVTLEEVAAQLGQTPSAISHRLKRKFGMSFSNYMARLRIEKAKSLFRHSDLKPAEVAQRVGIDDQSNFARLFRKVEGITPATYKKRYGKKP